MKWEEEIPKPQELLEKAGVFSTPARLAIMFLLYAHRRVGFTKLQRLLGLTPGNLDSHIRRLRAAGYVKKRKVLAWRPMVVIEITPEGAQTFRDFATELRKLLEAVK